VTRRPETGVAWLAAAAFLPAALIAARDAGLAFDSHLSLPYGDALLRWISGGGPWPLTPYSIAYEVYGSLALLAAAAASAVLHDRLAVASALVGHHMLAAASAVALVGLTARLAAELFGVRAAVLATALLATMPRFFAEAGNGISDLPAAVASTAAVLGFVRAVRERRPAPLAGAAVAFAALSAIRVPNVLFLPGVPLLWLALDGDARRGAAALLRASRPAQLAAVCGLALACIWLFRPLAWTAPGVVLRTVYDGMVHPPPWVSKGVVNVHYGGRMVHGGPPSYQAVLLGLTTPLPVLAAAVAGGVYAWRRHRSAAWLLGAWLAVGVGRYALLGRGNYDGVRHVIEGFPALAALAGAGADAVLSGLAPRRWRMAGLVAGGLALAAPGAAAIWRLHPYPVVYYNALAGGLHGGAAAYDADYSGAVYRDGLAWAAANVAPEDVVWVPTPYERRLVETEAAYLGQDGIRTWAEEPERLAEHVRRAGGRVFVMQRLLGGVVEGRPGGLELASLPPVHELRRDGVPLLRIRTVPLDLLPGGAR
jgi:hypothetical protein